MTNLFSSLFLGAAAAAVARAAQSTTLCSAGECLTGQSNITRLGAILSSSASSATYLLLPGQYTSSVQPASLEQALSSATSTISFTTGFSNSTTSTTPSLPLTIALQPGLLNYPNDGYSGDPTFYALPQSLNNTNNPTSINRGSIILADNTVAAIEATNNGQKSRVVLWDNVPFISQLPYSMAGSLQVVSLLSTSCSPACSSGGICTTNGSCLCSPNFTGQSCEQCAEGHFGPQCQACPAGCSKCDQGITGTGACLTTSLPASAPSNCNCANGVCGSGGTCTCSAGWTTGTSQNNTQCNVCADGFFLNSGGNCEACGSGCLKCASGSGTCTQCQTGLTVSTSNSEACILSGPPQCENGQFASGTTCVNCATTCGTCNGASASNCITCADGFFFLNNLCVNVETAALGVCQGSTLIANRVKGVCDTCPEGCTNCQYTTFAVGTQISDAKCTKCLPGQFLSNGACVASCPDGTFAASDGTCTACSSSCGTCAGNANFCLTCKNNQSASNGTCVASCPSNTFTSGGSCVACHPDCSTCSGSAFNQCLSCPSNLPVLTSGKRCVTTCAQTEYFDTGSGTCKSCDSSCGSCSGGGSGACLSCSSPNQVLRAGTCENVDCGSGSGPTSGLGVCLAELVTVASGGPPVTIPPLNPNSQQPPSTHHGLAWWQILLIVLGAVLLLVIILLCWRRRARKKRAQQTEQFKDNLKNQGLWRKLWRNPFSAWMARRRSRALSRRSPHDIERMSDAKDWRSNESSGDRRAALGVPQSISRGSWVTMGQHTNRRPSLDGRSYNVAGLGAIREGERYGDDDWRTRSHEGSYHHERRAPSVFSDSVSRRYDERREESRYYGQEIEQEDSRTEVTYDPYQYPRPNSRGSDTPSMIKSEYTEGDRYDDRTYNHQRSRTRDDRSYRQDYPSSVTTRTTTSRSRSQRYPREEQRSYNSRSQRPYREDVRIESPSIYSQPSQHPRVAPLRDPSIRDPALTSRFSMSTTAASAYDRNKRKPAPAAPSEAEMYKLSKMFDLINLFSPKKETEQIPIVAPQPVVAAPGSRNPFRI